MTRQKKTVIGLLALLLVLVLLIAALPLVLSLLDQTPPRRPIEFADPSLSLYPELDSDYMSLNRAIYYVQKGTTTIKTELTEEDYAHKPKSARIIITMIKAALAGDAEAYNALFSPEYLAAAGRENGFTKQKLYDIAIIEYSVSAAVPDGYEKVSLYGLAYKIKDNNGSLRSDVGSDAELEQHLTVVEDVDGNVYIHGINVVLTK